jgi:beta-galactosidase
VRGWNYHLGEGTDNYHREHPAQPNIGSEQASTMTTRGIYTRDEAKGYVAAYDGEPHAGTSASDWWMFFDQRPWLSGGFVWTGFDYRGEPTPYNWPCINSHFGIIDTCGFPKDNFYYYRAWWTTNIVLHLLPHWNWPGKEGQEIRVDALSNCRQVELFLNGTSLGKKDMVRDAKLSWLVKYQPGTLSAKGYDADGYAIAETKIETTGDATQIQLAPDRVNLGADSKDLSVITVAIADADGRVVPTADNPVHFELSGPGKIIGVGNGDPSCHEPDAFISQPALRTGTMNRWWTSTLGKSDGKREVAEKFNDTRWDLADVSGGDAAVPSGAAAVFRAHLFVAQSDLELTNILIHFGAIKNDGWIYVNGKLAGESHDPAASPDFNLRKFLHAGINTVAVLVKSGPDSGGISGGVRVELPGAASVAHWQRSAFNGLAQVLVQSEKTAGDITLTTTGDGLKTAVTVIHAN